MAVALTVLLPALLFSGYLLARFAGQDREQNEQRLRYSAQDLANNIDHDLAGIKTVLRTLAVSRALDSGDFAEFHRQATEALADSGLVLLVLDRNLQQLVNTSLPFGTLLPTTSDPETALTVLKTKQAQVSDLFIGRVVGRLTLDVHMPVLRGGEVRYILIMGLRPERMLGLLQAVRLPIGWISGLSDSKGKVIARSELHERFVNTSLPAELFAQRYERKVLATKNLESIPVLRAVARLSQADWVAAVNVPTALIEASARGSVQVALVSGLALLLLSALVAIAAGRLLAAPIMSLADAAQALGKGAAIAPITTVIKEANEVSEALYFASVELEQRAFTDARLAAVVRSSQDAIVGLGLDLRIQSWNAGAERIFGYTAEDVIGQSSTMLVPADRRREPIELASRICAGEAMVSIETERVRKDGTAFPAHVTISHVISPEGKLLAFSALVIDVSAHKAIEKQRDLLSRELLHRVKNTLAVIQAIARQTFRSGGEQADVFVGRVHALAAAHDVLTRADWDRGELGEVARAQLASHLVGSAPAVTLAGPRLTLPRSTAVPLGLVLHELATNAAKYGALSVPGGSVEVTWTVESEAGSWQVQLTWRERGGPPITGAPQEEGFGSALIERSLPDAEIERRFDPKGFVCTVKLRLAYEHSRP